MRKNQVRIIGHLGQKPRQLNGKNQEFTGFAVAVSNDYFDKTEKKWVDCEPTWIECVAFAGKPMSDLKDLEAGSRLQVEGSLSVRKIEIDGKRIPVTTLVATHIESLAKLRTESSGMKNFIESEVPEWDTANHSS